MLKILRLLFVARIELFNNNARLAPLKTKQQQRRAKHNGQYWVFKLVKLVCGGRNGVALGEWKDNFDGSYNIDTNLLLREIKWKRKPNFYISTLFAFFKNQ